MCDTAVAASASAAAGRPLLARDVPAGASLGENTADALGECLRALSIDEKARRKEKAKQGIQPGDFVMLQSIRSSALARKQNTTSKFACGGATLFSDLLNKPSPATVDQETTKKNKDAEEVKKEEKKRDEQTSKEKKPEEKKDDDEGVDSDSELISRGPVRAARTPVNHHPYAHPGHAQPHYGVAAQSTVDDYNAAFSNYGGGYECGAGAWQDSPSTTGYISSSSTPDTFHPDHGYGSSGGYSPVSQHSPITDASFTVAAVGRLLRPPASVGGAGGTTAQKHSPPSTTASGYSPASSSGASSDDEEKRELPDRLAEFILSYSRNYSDYLPSSEGGSSSPDSTRPGSADGAAASPLSANGAPLNSPAAPRPGYSCNSGSSTPRGTPAVPAAPDRPARLRMRATIAESELNSAIVWLARTIKQLAGEGPAALDQTNNNLLTYQDEGNNSINHLLIADDAYHKLYVVVEQQLKMEAPAGSSKPFDLKNNFHETPFHLAVIKRVPHVVEYLLEAGADPNAQSIREERNAPLHLAASLGSADIVKLLVADPRTQLDLKNGLDMTALQCAVHNHGIVNKFTKMAIDNTEVIRILLEAGADPACPMSDGKTIAHMAVEKLNHEMIELLKRCLKEETMYELVNKADFNHVKPIDRVQHYKGQIDEQTYSNMFFALLTCGANVGKAA